MTSKSTKWIDTHTDIRSTDIRADATRTHSTTMRHHQCDETSTTTTLVKRMDGLGIFHIVESEHERQECEIMTGETVVIIIFVVTIARLSCVKQFDCVDGLRSVANQTRMENHVDFHFERILSHLCVHKWVDCMCECLRVAVALSTGLRETRCERCTTRKGEMRRSFAPIEFHMHFIQTRRCVWLFGSWNSSYE